MDERGCRGARGRPGRFARLEFAPAIPALFLGVTLFRLSLLAVPAALAGTAGVTPSEVVVILAPSSPPGSLGPRSDEALSLPERARRVGVAARGARPVLAHPSAREAFSGDAWVLALDPGVDPGTAAAALSTDPQVLYAGPNHFLEFTQTLPDDPIADDQYALFSSRVFEAWEVTDGSGVLIAIVDSGVELDHPDLVHQIAVNEAEANGAPGVDDDGNGFVDDVRGYDFTDVPGWPGVGDYLERDPDPSDDLGHGTQVAGVAAAERNNGIGIAGVAPGARILPVRAGFRTALPFGGGLLQEDDAAAAILYAADRGARVINLSFGDVVDAPLLRHAVRYAQSRGALVVVSAGNTGSDEAHYPAAYPGVLVPGASTREDTRAGFSTFGQDMDLLAPGLGLISTVLGGGYGLVSGTSFSAPMTAGVAALVWSVHPTWSPAEVAWRLRLTARRTQAGWTPGEGWGLLSAAEAVADTRSPPVVEITSQDQAPDRTIRLAGTIADPGLSRWSLAAVPDSMAVESARAGPVPGERALVREASRQAVAESLAAFTPGPADAGLWVFRLEAQLRDGLVLEERSRALVSAPSLRARNLSLEMQAGARGWSLAASWSSGERHQGALQLTGPGTVDHFAEEMSLATHHGLRLADPLPAGPWTVLVLGRGSETAPYTTLAETVLTVPVPIDSLRAIPGDAYGRGTPMPRTLDMDGDGNPEIFLEEPPENDLYGFLRGLEVLDGTAVEWGSSEGIYRGIPVDAADADGDGKLELVVFRLAGWKVWEATLDQGFPDREIFDADAGENLPSRFVTTPGGVRLLVVAGSTARLLRSDPVTGYAVESESDSPGPNLTAQAVQGDFDGDGVDEVGLVNEGGGVVLFELGMAGIRFDRVLTGPFPVAPTLGTAHPASGGVDLVTTERDPEAPGEGGDLDRAATRLRRWRWNGTRFVEIGALGFAGMNAATDLQILEAPGGFLLRRGGLLDAVGLPEDGRLEWRGRVHASGFSRVDGAVFLQPLGGADQVWVGTSDATYAAAELVSLEPRFAPRQGSPLRVVEARTTQPGLDILLEWEPDGCEADSRLTRTGDQLGSYPVPVVGNQALDPVALGERVVYDLQRGGCSPQTLAILGSPPEQPAPRWQGADLLLPLTVPLGQGDLPRVLLKSGERTRAPEAVHSLTGGRGFLISPGGSDVDSLVVMNAWLNTGLPLGGSLRAAAAVPPRPEAQRSPVLAEARYAPEHQAVRVTLAGDSLACDPRFRLEPGDADLSSTARGGSFLVVLPAPLAPGVYTLRLHADCLDPEAEGQERAFGVGRLLYPNPIGPGEDLVIENVEPGTRIAIHDLRGAERLAWTVAGSFERRAIGDLPPGLYVVRFQAPDGSTAGLEKLAVIR